MASEHDNDYDALTDAGEWQDNMDQRTSLGPPPIESEVTKVVANLLEEDPQPSSATTSCSGRWRSSRPATTRVAQAMVDDGATEVGSSDVNHGIMRFWRDYGGGTLATAKWDDFLKDHPSREPEVV